MGEVVVSMNHINKSFPGVKALDDAKLTLRSGEVMALLGENGAGKSTLMKILAGIYSRDDGEMMLFGENVGKDYSAKRAREMGVAIIHQELNMCQHLTVAENMFLGRELSKGGKLDDRKMNELAGEQLAKLGIHDLEPTATMSTLPVGRQQMVEISKALMLEAKIIIMDEPTSALSNAEVEELFRLTRDLRAEGKSIVYISHRLQELQHIVDTVTIMRDGKYITEGKFSDFTMDSLIANMVGREITNQFPRDVVPRGDKVLEVKGLSSGKMVNNVSFDVYAGEVLGFAGLVGAGRTEMSRAVFGIDRKDSGQLVLEGNEIKTDSPVEAIDQGIVLIPEDRKRDGLCTKLSVRENIALPNLPSISGFLGKVDKKKEAEIVDKGKASLTIKMSDPDVLAGTLSGGNQQKVVVAKWLARDAKVVIFDEPTRGIDVAAKVEIYEIINQLKKEGKAIIMISSEMPEVMGISDRILVMCEGRITGELSHEEATENRILSYAMQFEDKAGKTA